MRFCKYCGSQIEDDIQSCPHCGKELRSQAQKNTALANLPLPTSANSRAEEIRSRLEAVRPWLKKPLTWGILAAVVLIFLLVFVFNGKCDYGSCKNKVVNGYDYCYTHKCSVSDCNISCYSYSNYCYSHALLYDEDAFSSSSYVSSYELNISNVRVYSSSNYTYAEGTVTNNGDSTVTFLKIKGSFENSYGSVVDTDWTYAVGTEGLDPGESCKWKLSVKKDYSISDCEISILDYDY